MSREKSPRCVSPDNSTCSRPAALTPGEDMGDVLAKEHTDRTAQTYEPTALAETPPLSPPPAQLPPVASEPPLVELLAGYGQQPSDDDDPRPESPATQSSECKEDRLSTEVVLSEQSSIENGDDTATSDNDEQCQTASTTTDDLCNCEDCNWRKKDLSSEDLQEMMKLRRLGMDLRQYIRYSFNWYMENIGFSDNLSVPPMPQEFDNSDGTRSFVELQESVALLCDRIPCHLFMWLVGQAQEFVIGVKVQLLTLLYDRSNDNLAEVFLTKLLDGYDALLATAVHISDLLEPLQKELLNKVNLSWEQINKRLYQNYVYSDPLIQNNLPPFIAQLRKHLPIKSSEYHDLVHRYLGFDDEITKIGPLSPEIERLIDKYNAEQVTGSVMKKVREDFERFKTRLKHDESSSSIDLSNKNDPPKEDDEDDEDDSVENGVIEEVLDDNSDFQPCSLPNAIEIQSMFNDWKKSPQQRLADLVEALTLSTVDEDKSTIMKETKCYPASTEKIAKDDINKSISCEKESCNCNLSAVNAGSIVKREVAPNLSNNNAKQGSNDVGNVKDPTSTIVSQNSLKQNTDCCKEPMKKVTKSATAQSTIPQTRHTTTQTPSVNHNRPNLYPHNFQGRCSSHSHLHGSLSNGVIKSFGPHRTHVAHNNHPSAAVTCHKQHIVEHIKRLSTSDSNPGENGDCSDSGSSQGGCSATNSPTPRDSNRHCDCCYCEVFGHGVPSVAPVSRNYNEMRERLRQLLSKKKAKVCASTCNTHPKNSAEVSSSSSSLSSSSSTSSTMTNVDATTLPNPVAKTTQPVVKNTNAVPLNATRAVNVVAAAAPTVTLPQKEVKWDLDAAVEFIEGSQNGKKNSKKAEKKARQKQKKLEEKMKKDKQEEERLRLIELQKKTPEVTITVVNSQKPGFQRSAPQKKLPEVSILPAKSMPQPVLSTSKQANAKNKNSEVVSNPTKNANKAKTTSAVRAVEGAKKKTASVEKNNEVTNVGNTKSKSFGESRTNEPAAPPPIDPSTLTKKERKKLRREMLKQEALKKELETKQPTNSSEQLQIVTIKRVMETINSEPTVTITLKGQTPAQDRVLFTLVNGQTTDSAGDKQEQSINKNKKNQGNNSANREKTQSGKKSQQSTSNNSNAKSEVQKNSSKNTNQQQASKSKSGKSKDESKPRQQPTTNVPEVKTTSTKSKKDKKKTSNENKENVKQNVNENSQKQESDSTNKKSNKTATTQQAIPKKQQQQQQQQVQQQSSNANNKNAKANKNQNQNKTQNQNQNQNQNQKKNANGNQTNSAKGNSGNNQSAASSKTDNQKAQKANQNTANKPKPNIEVVQQQRKEPIAIPSNRKSNNTPTTINIENLKLPPGITITKVDAPSKPISIRTNTAPKAVNNAPKQTTIIAAPLSGIQATGYANPQGTGNVIVVDTGRLKQDLSPKSVDKDLNNQTATSKKKKKKKNKNASTATGNEKVNNPALYQNIDSARILHNPSTNMVTIRNPAFGPPPPKMESCPNQAAIIKVGDNGMVTIRSPALQQAINMGLTPPPKPDFVVKGSGNTHEIVKSSHNNYMNSSDLSGTARGSNGMPLSTDLSELRRRLGQPADNERTSSTLFNNGLSSIQISKVTSGQSPNIPENGINLKGTSVTLTKIRNPEMSFNQNQQQPATGEAKGNAATTGNPSTKSRKKKKRGNGVRQGGDDWNLVESVFTPKDIDLEDGEMDDAERELEAFKRFCLQSVPPPRKEKVNLNLKDIVLKKKSSDAQANAPVLAAI